MSRTIDGLPGQLPPGEHILWQGAPAWRPLARRLCHVRPVGCYFGALAAGDLLLELTGGTPVLHAGLAVLPVVASGVAVLAFLYGLAWMVARTTRYTLTTHRLVMTLGIALPATLAIPHSGIAHAGVRLDPDGSGDLPIRTKRGYAVAIHRVWPHARPLRWRRAEPMLRSVPAAGVVAALLARTLATAESDCLRAGSVAAPAGKRMIAPELLAAD